MSKFLKKLAHSTLLLSFIFTISIPVVSATTFKDAFIAKGLRQEAMTIVGIDTFNDSTYETIITDDYKQKLSQVETLNMNALAGVGSGTSNGRPMRSETSFNSPSVKVYFYSDVNRMLYQNGLEYFTGIKSLDLSGHALNGKLDLTNNPNLETVRCSYNVYKTLDTAISSVDISKCPNLKNFDCSYNHITELDMYNNPKLETVNCSYNKLKELDFSKNKNLKSVDCTGNDDLKVLKVKSGVTITGYSGEVTYAGSVYTDNIGLFSAITSIAVVIIAIATLTILNKRRRLSIDNGLDESDYE